jgi:hypothetical protein
LPRVTSNSSRASAAPPFTALARPELTCSTTVSRNGSSSSLSPSAEPSVDPSMDHDHLERDEFLRGESAHRLDDYRPRLVSRDHDAEARRRLPDLAALNGRWRGDRRRRG